MLTFIAILSIGLAAAALRQPTPQRAKIRVR